MLSGSHFKIPLAALFKDTLSRRWPWVVATLFPTQLPSKRNLNSISNNTSYKPRLGRSPTTLLCSHLYYPIKLMVSPGHEILSLHPLHWSSVAPPISPHPFLLPQTHSSSPFLLPNHWLKPLFEKLRWREGSQGNSSSAAPQKSGISIKIQAQGYPHFLTWSSFLCDDSSLCQVDTQNQPVQHSMPTM